MSTRIASQVAGSLASYRYPADTYDPDKLGLGRLMVQQNGGGDASFVGPVPIAVVRPMEASTTIPYVFPWTFRWSQSSTSKWDWTFLADNATAAATRRFGLIRFDRLTGTPTYDGFITVTFPGTSEAKTIRYLRGDYSLHTAGTASASGTAVTGSSSTWKTDGACVGNRIGFGSSDPAAIVTWYEISAITNDTSITLTTSAGTVGSGAYVIEDLRLLVGVTSVTTSNGGLYVVKGLRRELFSSGGGAVPAAVSTDNIRACYYLKDAASGTALAVFGASLEDPVSKATRYLWQLHTLANPIMQKYNVRAALTVSSGADTTALSLITGSGGAVTGTTSQLNNGRMANCAHGPGSGLNCIYFTTTTRIYRTQDVSGISAASTSWLIDNMTEVPPGGTNTYALGAGIQAIEFMDSIDKFLVTTTGAAGIRSYITQYNTTSAQMDRIILSDFKQIDQGSADATITPFPSQQAAAFTVWVEDGLACMARNGTTAILNQIYYVPIGADWEYADTSKCYVIWPRMALTNAASFIAAYINAVEVLGGATGHNLGMSPQPVRLKYRTTGIADDSGSWTLLANNGDMSGVAGASYIQFRTDYRMDNTLIPGRVLRLAAAYNDTGMSDYWYGSANVGTDLSTKKFGFYFATAYGSTVPRLRIDLTDATSGASLGTDDSTTQAWTWEKSTNDGGAWSAYNTTDRANSTTYIRVTPISLADSIKVRAVLREY